MIVHIVGCVERPGEVHVPRFAKLRRAIFAAGGVKRRFLLRPSGVITVRSDRRWGSKSQARHFANFRTSPQLLDRIRLRKGDRIIVGCMRLLWWLGKTPDVLRLRPRHTRHP